jgi:UDP-glucose 4-epimerase
VCHLAARAGVRASIIDPYIYVHSNIEGEKGRIISRISRHYCAQDTTLPSLLLLLPPLHPPTPTNDTKTLTPPPVATYARTGTTRLLDLARHYGCANFVYASSSSVYGSSTR